MVELLLNDGNDILDNLWANVINSGARKRRHDSTHLGLILSAIATEMNVVVTLLQSYANQFTLQTATDRILVENLSKLFANRRLSSKSKTILTFYRLEGYTESARIPVGFAVRAAGSPNIIFKTAETVHLWKGEQSVSVVAYSINSGAQNNVDANTLTIFANNQFNGSIAVTNLEPSYGGYDDESIEHLRNRASGFRYERDATLQDIERQLYEAGIPRHRYYAVEYIDDIGSYMICIDTDTEQEFEDVKSRLEYRSAYGIEASYVRATRIYVDMYVTVKTVSDVDYSPQQKTTIYNNINTAIQRFFAAYCTVGANIRVNAIKSSLINALSGFEIADVDINIANMDLTDETRRIIAITETQRAIPNEVITNIEFIGGDL